MPGGRPRKKKPEEILNNGLASALLGTNPFGLPTSIGTQLNQVDTIFKNNRWYLISNMRQVLSEIYVEHGIIQTVVNVPVDDALRGGVLIKSKQLEPEQIEELCADMEEQNDLQVVAHTNYWNRLFGGAGTMVITDQDPKTPLDIESIREGEPLEFRDVDMWELFWTKQNTADYAAAIDQNDFNVEFYDYYGKKVHHSRVFKLKGLKAPSFIRPRLRGWGISVVECLVNCLNQYLKSNNLIFEVLDEFKVDVYKIKNLSNTLLSANGETQIQRRVQLANQQKNYQNAITMDGEDDFIQKELSFAGIAETMQGIRMQIASDLRMPLTKVFGISAAGFSSGEDDIENYNSMIESSIRQPAKFHILKIVKLRCQQKYGFIPDDLSISFKPLRILSAEQEENVKTQKFNRLLAARQASEITLSEFRDGCNSDSLLPIQLESDPSLEAELEAEKDAQLGDAAGEGGEAPEKKTKSATQPKVAKS